LKSSIKNSLGLNRVLFIALIIFVKRCGVEKMASVSVGLYAFQNGVSMRNGTEIRENTKQRRILDRVTGKMAVTKL
jgi:hypothetical protein